MTGTANEAEQQSVKMIVESAQNLWTAAKNEQDKAEAISLFQQAYNMGEARISAYRLGGAYFYGQGVEQNYSTALKYFSNRELDRNRYALYFRGLVLRDENVPDYDPELAADFLAKAVEMGVEPAKKQLDVLQQTRKCPVCGTPPADMSGGKTIRACSGCGALERHRIFACAYVRAIRYSYNLEGKSGLIIGPVRAEKTMLKKFAVARLASLDIRPETGTDVVGDICELPRSEHNKYDFVFASSLLTYVSDIDDAIAGMRRALKPGGFVITVDPAAAGDNTREITDPEKIAAVYGREILGKYRVGSFRRLGEKGLLASLSRCLNVQPFRQRDPVNGGQMTVFVSTRTDKKLVNKIARRDKEYIGGIIEVASEKEKRADNEVSKKYYKAKAKFPETSYATVSLREIVAMVANAERHPTLGENITDESATSGIQRYLMYKNLLDIKPADKVLEYGCGSLRVGVGIIKNHGFKHYFGLDVVPEFYDLGRKMVGEDLIKEKGAVLQVIDEESIQQGVEFEADVIFASAVIFHIHPDEIKDGFRNLVRLASKPGARVIFDAKISRGDAPDSYLAADKKRSGWAWPLDFYRRGLKPLELVGVHNRKEYYWAPELDLAHLEFRNPITGK